MRAALARAIALAPLLAACAPVPVAQAERDCAEEARLAERPRGEAIIGMASGGRTVARVQMDISTDYLAGRDPEKVWQSCVYRRSGQLPTRPYSSLPAEPGRTGPMRRG